MSWKPEIDELQHRRELAQQMGGEANIKRHHDNGKLTVRERIDRLLDPDSFQEIGTLAGSSSYSNDGILSSFRPANFVMGLGRINGRRVVVGGDDFTVRGGAADASIAGKQGYSERMAREFRLPLVRLVDGTGGGGSVKSYETSGYTYVPANPAWDIVVEAMNEIPIIGAVMGSVAGLGAARAVCSHFSLMVKETSQLFVAGPPLVKYATGQEVPKERLGGADIHVHESGAVDNEAESEEDAFWQIRRFLSYMPQNIYEMPPWAPSQDDPVRREEELLTAIPRNRRHVHDVRRIINLTVDTDSFFEIAPYYGPSEVIGLARLNGYPIGVAGNDPRFYGGAATAESCEKMIRFIDMCDTFHLPVVNFVDQPGFLIGVDGERAGTIRIGARLMAAVYQASVPWIQIILRRVFGVAGAAQGNAHKLNWRYAWPSGDWGSLPLEGGIEAAYKRDLANSPDPEGLRQEIEERLNRVRSPFRTAEHFGIEEIIDPRDTRPLLCDWIEMAYDLESRQPGPKTRGMRP
ncbi:MAG: methylmalonyl-CoA carboxyltransferase [Candidatus Tectomicrobia bacterium]|uniref:Methylmalonyl-CoA carboxyltransferase n=1 Tax=Tectimicrobiota bacterium TaxID=2528274 RepID=A0A933GKR3_UNCTE|nr:methylmalonyl-CoA carboxyltransferase [Candidatus Tectomicrobia bacterium]